MQKYGLFILKVSYLAVISKSNQYLKLIYQITFAMAPEVNNSASMSKKEKALQVQQQVKVSTKRNINKQKLI